ncbi:MAG: ABC transporter ATP-binding protein [Armatimonadota bacterium]|nr:ABC transporter ATP-binding protein [Armatimonadota bacterium]
MAEAIKIRNLTKVYSNFLSKDKVLAVDSLNLDIHEGEIFGFLGPNGAGKTTTIKMLLGLIFPTSGEAEVLGKPAGDIETKRRLSYLPESPYFYEYMTGTEALEFYARLFGMGGAQARKKADELLTQVGLGGAKKKSLREYSKGMLQRIGIAQALVNDPSLLFLDEPTSGLDPIAHMDIRDLILQLREQGKTVFLSSHQLTDVEMVCDRVSIMVAGKLLKMGSLDELLKAGATEVVARKIGKEALRKLRSISHQVDEADKDKIVCLTPNEASQQAVCVIVESRGEIISVTPQRNTLEELFIRTVREAEE